MTFSPADDTQARHGKILVLGLGNDILRDDAVGLRVVRDAGRQLEGHPDVVTQECCEMGLSLLDFITGYSGLILVDSVQTQKAERGFVHELVPADLKAFPSLSPHFLGVGEILVLGRQLSLPMPERVKIFAIEVEDPFTLSTEMTPLITGIVPSVVARVLAAIQDWRPIMTGS